MKILSVLLSATIALAAQPDDYFNTAPIEGVTNMRLPEHVVPEHVDDAGDHPHVENPEEDQYDVGNTYLKDVRTQPDHSGWYYGLGVVCQSTIIISILVRLLRKPDSKIE